MKDSAQDAIDWTLGVLSESGKAFLAALPLCVREGDICLVHASAADPGKWEYVEDKSAAHRSIGAAGAAYTFSGHLHEQVLYSLSGVGKIIDFRPLPGSPVPVASHRSWLALVGAVGQQRDGNPAASYALFDRGHQAITFFRVPYDTEAAARKVRAAGLPESLAVQVEQGS
jgi:diadenosine tetraphosphatase ApaH/serine/threonine PP2A family protein phosphatase